jgi:hypothetical protein
MRRRPSSRRDGNIESVSICLAQDPGGLDAEVEPGGRLIVRVHLEILCDGIGALPEHLKQRRIRGLRGQDRAWQQNDPMPSRHAAILFVPATTRSAAPVMRNDAWGIDPRPLDVRAPGPAQLGRGPG